MLRLAVCVRTDAIERDMSRAATDLKKKKELEHPWAVADSPSGERSDQ